MAADNQSGRKGMVLAAVIAFGYPGLADAGMRPVSMPDGFVWLSQVDPSIVEDMRYATRRNFTHARLPGYLAGVCILAEPVARALAKVQAGLKEQGLTLVMHDCYRPARAVHAMAASMRERPGTDAEYHPNISGRELVDRGYVASRSGHSSGGSVDVSLARRDGDRLVPLNMGTSFDFFDPASHTAAAKSEPARTNRAMLVKAMTRNGFANYAREWWHFRYSAEPFKGRQFDFPVIAPAGAKTR